MTDQIATEGIERKKQKIDSLSQYIWNHPETGFREYKAQEKATDLLREEGLQAEAGAGNVPAAIKTIYGSGHPVMGFLDELDVLPGPSQKVLVNKEPVGRQLYGHDCGHNLLCSAHVAGVIGLKEGMIQKSLPGTTVFHACPGEELLTGKPLMAKGGVLEGLDVTVNFHPNKINETTVSISTAMNFAKFHFYGKASHTVSMPKNGRSALDAVELTDIDANYLREHVPSDMHVHYTIVDGGVAPNIMPDRAVVRYYMRAFSGEVVEDVYERLVKVAKGAAMITEIELKIELFGGCYGTQNNHVLAGAVAEAMNETPQKPWTQEELDFAAALDEQTADAARAATKKYGLFVDTYLYTGPGQVTCFNSYGSIDAGDVMHLVLAAYFLTACTNMGTSTRSWQSASYAGSSIDEKGMIYTAKVMTLYGLKLIKKPGLTTQTKEKFDRQMEDRSCKCLISDGMTVPW